MTWSALLAGFLAAANADPAKFADPHRFDITRHPNPHLSFGTGAHFCLGFQLARAEIAIAFERILSRYPNMRLAVDERTIAWRRRLGIRALVRLPVQFTARAIMRDRRGDACDCWTSRSG